MVDAGDLSSEQEIVRVAAGLSRIDPTIPTGVTGECDDCGEMMPRLVGGLCGFCRDGRRPPAERYAAAEARIHSAPPIASAEAPAPSRTTQEKEPTMPNPPPSADFQAITMPARGDLLKAIRDHAAKYGTTLSKAAMALIEQAIAEAAEEPTVVVEAADVARLQTPDLLSELERRLNDAVSPSRLAAAEARAAAAETRLAQAAALLSGTAA